ncbi:MAG: PorT family protein [Muribaculaceae bacterium]|nr:PorT family protein [Muribaculaceae bacterium]
MNRLFHTIIALFLMSVMWEIDVLGQTHYDANIAFGVKGGAGVSRVFFNPSVRQKLKVGGTAGVTFRYIEEKYFGLIAECLWTQRGWKENFDKFQKLPYKYERTLNYIQIPVMAHIYFGRRGRFFFNAGPEVGIFIGESSKSNFDPWHTEDLPDFPNRNRTNSQMTMKASQKFDYGISAGLGGEFNINRIQSVCIEARFYFGLGNIFPSARADVFSASNSMSVMLTAGYWFRIK